MSEDAANFRTMFAFSPPENAPQAWELTFDHLVHELHAKDPDALVHEWSGQFSGETLSFQFRTASGEESEGMAGIEPNGVAIEECTAADAADFAAWLRHAIVPAGAEIIVNIREGVEWELPPVALPNHDVTALEQLLVSHVERVLQYEEEQLG
jgi:hypothetical protein